MIGIYKITNPIGKVYVGQSRNIKQRFSSYVSGAVNKKLLASFLEYGIENHKFEVIEKCSIKSLNKRERYWQIEYDVIENGLNFFLTKPKRKPKKGEVYRLLFEKSGFKKNEIQRRLNTTWPTIARYEKQTDIDLTTIKRFSQLLGVSESNVVELIVSEIREMYKTK